MNKFVYQDVLIVPGAELSYDVCYPIKTKMSFDDLIAYLQLQAETFKSENPKEDVFYPFGEKDYPMSASSFLGFRGINFKVILIPIEEWKGVTVQDMKKEFKGFKGFKDLIWEEVDTEETEREPFWEIRDLKEVQEKSALSDDYNLGLYNGMELCLSLLEKREPKYKDLPQADRRK